MRVLVRPASQRGELVDLPVEWVNGDLLDAGSLQTAMHGVKQVYHLAATMDDWGPWELFYQANVTGTENVCAAALAAGVERLIFTSSIAATGLEDYSGLKDESFPYVDSQRQGQHAYCVTKALGEQVVRRYHDERGLPAVILRPTYVYGPREHKVGPYIVARVVRRGLRLLPGNGRNWHHWVYVGDVVQALLLAAQPGVPTGRPYLIGGPLDHCEGGVAGTDRGDGLRADHLCAQKPGLARSGGVGRAQQSDTESLKPAPVPVPAGDSDQQQRLGYRPRRARAGLRA